MDSKSDPTPHTSDPSPRHIYPQAAAVAAMKVLNEPGDLMRDAEHPEAYTVRGHGGVLYRLHVIEGPPLVVTCTCPNGRALGDHPTCYHSLAVRIHHEEARRHA